MEIFNMEFVVINTDYKYYPFHWDSLTFTDRLMFAKVYDTEEEAERACEYLHQTMHTYHFKVFDKNILLRADKLKKINKSVK